MSLSSLISPQKTYVVQILGELFKECFVQGSDDEDERGLDRFEEMEGDLDDIDEDKERDKVIMIFVICESKTFSPAGENRSKDGLG